MSSGDKGLYFFKVFDLSFFAPGLVIALTLAWVWNGKLSGLQTSLTTAGGIHTLIIAVGLIYSFGLTVFPIM